MTGVPQRTARNGPNLHRCGPQERFKVREVLGMAAPAGLGVDCEARRGYKESHKERSDGQH